MKPLALVGLLSGFLLFPYLPFAEAVPIPPGQTFGEFDGYPVYGEGDEQVCCSYYIEKDGTRYPVIEENGTWHSLTSIKEKGLLAEEEALSGASALFSETFNQTMEDINRRHLQELYKNRTQKKPTVKKVHIVFVEFPDARHTYDATHFMKMLFSKKTYLNTPDHIPAYGSASDYWYEVSRGEIQLKSIPHYPEEGKWFMMPEPKSVYGELPLWYADPFYEAVIQTAGMSLAPEDKLVIVAAGGPIGPRTVFWPHVDRVNGTRMVLMERFWINGVLRFLPMGVAAHEFGHMLFGLKDFGYSTSYWDLMGLGVYGYGDYGVPNAEKPVHPCAVNRVTAGFATVESWSGEGIRRMVDYHLPDVESTGKILHLENEDNDTDFYLEVRQNSGNIFDSDIQGNKAGLVAWFTFQSEALRFPYAFGGFFPQKVGYLNASESVTGFSRDGYWGNVTSSAFPGSYGKTEIGYSTTPSFSGNRYTHLHHLTHLRKESSSVLFDLERRYFQEKINVIALEDGHNGTSEGNRNRIPEPGETIEAILRIENQGALTIPPFSGSFTNETDLAWFSTPFATPELPPGGFVETTREAFKVLSAPASGNVYYVRLLHDGQFNFSKDKLVLTLPSVLEKEFSIISDPNLQRTPKIDDKNIIWIEDQYGTSSIYLYHLGPDGLPATHDLREGVYPIAASGSFQSSPLIQGHIIAWKDQAEITQRIVVYHLGSDGLPHTGDTGEGEYEIVLAYLPPPEGPAGEPSRGSIGYPSLDGNAIVWDDSRNLQSDVYLYHFGLDGIPFTGDTNEGEYPVTADLYYQTAPSIYGNNIVWLDFRNSNLDIYLYHLGPDGIPGTHDIGEGEYPVIVNPNYRYTPVLYGNSIIWTEDRDGRSGLFLYHLGPDGIPGTHDIGEGEYPITTLLPVSEPPAIFENTIVWSTEGTLYLYHLGPDGIPNTYDEGEGEYQIAADSGQKTFPSIYQRQIVCQEDQNDNSDVSLLLIKEFSQEEVTPYNKLDDYSDLKPILIRDSSP